MYKTPFRLAVLAGALTAMACVQDVREATYVPVGPATVSLGAGHEAYVALADGDSVPIVLGPQGGYMIALGLRAGGVVPGDPVDVSNPDNPRIHYRARLVATGEVIGSITIERGLYQVSPGTHELVGTWLVFASDVEPTTYFDQDIEIDVSLVDVLGSEPTDLVTVVTTQPPPRPR